MKKTLVDVEELPEIPNPLITFWGDKVDSREDVWHFDDVASTAMIIFSRIKNSYIRYIVKLFIATQSVSKSLKHLRNIWYRLSNILGEIDSSKLDEAIIQSIDNYISDVRGTNNEHQIWYLKSWYLWCFDMGLPYFNEDYADYLSSISISGNSKGQAVMSLEENHGPLNDKEISCFTSLLSKDLYVSVEKTMAYLFLTLGCNPRNLSLIKWEDFDVVSSGDYKVYLLKVPRIKKRVKNRKEFQSRELDQRIGRIIEEFKLQKRSEYIFSDISGEPLTAQRIQVLFSTYARKLANGSEIDGIHLTPRRLRYTFATRLVMSGVSKERLADLLDHTDLQHVQVYYDLRNQIKGFLTEVENKKLGHILRRFEGNINPQIDNTTKDIKYYSLKANSALGKCGSDSHCELNAPYSCFVCPKFNAFSDSLDSYKEVQSDLLSWKASRKQDVDENDRIQFQMDEVISAVSDLITRIEDMK